ncbi:MAG: phosphate ABC transporter permease PstA [Bdellovibrio sp.]|nr:MAG: phosphate ABC transporter permease PstA [Bdellovibrio sp.]
MELGAFMNFSWRYQKNSLFKLFTLLAALFSLIALTTLLVHILHEGWQYLSPQLLKNFPSRFPHKAGIYPAIMGSLWLMILTFFIAVPLGLLSALYIEEYLPKGKWKSLIMVNIKNLSSMPSIIYGLLGLAIFIHTLGFDHSLLSGALTLSLLILPMIIITATEAIRAVPKSLRMASFALGAEKHQVVFLQVLPAALPGILTGIILSLSRAIGETAPLIVIGAATYISFTPESIMDPFTVIPLQIYSWTSRPQAEFHHLAASAIIVLMILLFSLNLLAVFIRNHFQKYKSRL